MRKLGMVFGGFLFGSACIAVPAEESKEPAATVAEDADGNFVLYVSNQSFDMDTVDIAVSLDGTSYVEGDFFVEDQHNWYGFTFQIDEGEHNIGAVTVDGAVSMAETFEAYEERRWAVINFWYNEEDPLNPELSFFVSDEAIGFD